MIEFIADETDAGERIDVVVARRGGVPRSAAQVALRAGEVKVGGRVVRPGHRLVAGEAVEGSVVEAQSLPPSPEDIPLDVVYSDDRVLVISKPAGLVTHPAGGHPSGTLVNALLALGVPLASEDPDRPGLVHRLDKDTSGLLLVAKDDPARAFLQAALKERRVGRVYLALVRGRPRPDSGTIEAPIGRHPARRKMAVVADGRHAVTHFRVLDATEKLALVEVTLETGRTHQIRVHLAHLGHPVLGDRTYGGASEQASALGLDRPFLHAVRLSFPHPDDERLVEVQDDLPADLTRALELAKLAIPS